MNRRKQSVITRDDDAIVRYGRQPVERDMVVKVRDKKLKWIFANSKTYKPFRLKDINNNNIKRILRSDR